jgi:hypothetical protein
MSVCLYNRSPVKIKCFPALAWSKALHFFSFPFFFSSFGLFHGPLQTAQLTQFISEVERIEVKSTAGKKKG